ncbi:hypothetical protein [Actinomadura fibrosa]|uniref:Uncharacterized protein n=1 Tax=Actinomadura fibrosa TaxID=111802 RepID=A0ABW2XMZ1_9ACTN|nr:hypothetical protein [Actinomadura fibrosa]
MKRAFVAAAVVAGVGAGLVRRLRSRAASRQDDLSRWLVVTVNVPPERFGETPEPLARLKDHIEIRTAPAPGGKGTELAARLCGNGRTGGTGPIARLSGNDPRQPVREALREAKSLIETGEIMKPDAPPTTRSTPGGKLVGLVTRRASGEGRL